ncbi:MAG: 50S ribosomal protein L23 [Candidatus Omnitrophica bacterium]|nr:50S ribosomal protein L23 [Candidatus Omnitrophota bacterium]
MNIYQIIKRVLTTEKGTMLSQYNKYFFEVNKSANKIDIKRAVEKIYNVKVDSVATVKIPSKPRRLKWTEPGKTSVGKKAIVTLKKGYTIEL